MKKFIFLLFLVSCNLKPHYERVDLGLEEQYRFRSEHASKYANTAWWKEFHDPALNRFIQIALDENKDLKVATARVLEFYSQYKVAFSKFFPELNAQFNVDRIQASKEIIFQPLTPGIPRINTLYSFLFNLSYELDFWGKIRNQTEAAKSLYLSEIYSRRNVIVGLVSSVAASYILLKQYLLQLEISKLTYTSRQESLRIAELRFNAGLVSELEVKQAESEALVAETQTKNFEILIAKQEDLLSVLLGKPPGPILEGEALQELSLPPSIPVGLPSDLLENRPDILQAEEKILAANADVGVAKAAFFPSFSLTGIWGQRSTSFNDFFKESATLWDLGLQAFEPLFTGWRLTNQLSEKESILVEALYSYQQAILTALQEVNDALIAHEKAKEKFQLQQNRVQALKDYLHLAQLRYFNGQNDYLTVLDAEKSLFVTELEAASTQGDLFITLISLYKALGQGWEVEEEEADESDDAELLLVGPAISDPI